MRQCSDLRVLLTTGLSCVTLNTKKRKTAIRPKLKKGLRSLPSSSQATIYLTTSILKSRKRKSRFWTPTPNFTSKSSTTTNSKNARLSSTQRNSRVFLSRKTSSWNCRNSATNATASWSPLIWRRQSSSSRIQTWKPSALSAASKFSTPGCMLL